MLDLRTIHRLILASSQKPKTEYVSLEKSVGRVLAHDISSTRDIPEWDISAFDGIALKWDAMKNGTFDFSIIQLGGLGFENATLDSHYEAIEIKKGSPIPEGADTVIPSSDVQLDGEGFFRSAHVNGTHHVKGQGIWKRGDQCKIDQILVKQGTVLKPTHLAAGSLAHLSQVQVYKRPKVAIITDTFMKGESRFSTSAYVPAMVALLTNYGAEIELFSNFGDQESPAKWIKTMCSVSDAVVLLRTSERSNNDSLTRIIIEAGIKSFVDGARIKGSQKFWFGLYENKKPFWDISAGLYEQLLQATLYIKPWFDKSFELEPIEEFVSNSFSDDSVFRNLDYLPAKKVLWEGKLLAQPIGTSDFHLLSESPDGFVEVSSILEGDEECRFIPLYR